MFNNEFVGFIIAYNINEFGMCVSTDTVFPYLYSLVTFWCDAEET